MRILTFWPTTSFCAYPNSRSAARLIALDGSPLIDADDAIDRSFENGVHPGFA